MFYNIKKKEKRQELKNSCLFSWSFQNLLVPLQTEQHDSASIQWGDCLRLWLLCRRLFLCL
nr:MAG TPA: hypothetical protein [Caudoviricetes sp.]